MYVPFPVARELNSTHPCPLHAGQGSRGPRRVSACQGELQDGGGGGARGARGAACSRGVAASSRLTPRPTASRQAELQGLPIRSYLDQTVVPLLLQGMSQLVKEVRGGACWVMEGAGVGGGERTESVAQFLLGQNTAHRHAILLVGLQWRVVRTA